MSLYELDSLINEVICCIISITFKIYENGIIKIKGKQNITRWQIYLSIYLFIDHIETYMIHYFRTKICLECDYIYEDGPLISIHSLL